MRIRIGISKGGGRAGIVFSLEVGLGKPVLLRESD